MEENYTMPKVIYVLIGLASCVIIIAGIRAAEEIIIPFLLALFLTLIISTSVFWSKKKSIPLWVSILVPTLIIITVFTFIIFILGSNIQSLTENIPAYHDQLEERWETITVFWEKRGIDISLFKISDLINSKVIRDVTLESLGSLTVIVEESFMIFVLMIFMLIASSTFPEKVAALSSNKKRILKILDKIINSINHYMATKTAISLLTGLLVTFLLFILNIDHAIFWGFLAFLLNFIPNIGSIFAAIPVIFLTLIQFGFEKAVYIILGYIFINVVVGNFLEPRIMGKSVELSTVIIFMSLIFWGWALGPVGMFLSVPLTIVFKHFDSTRWLSILIGPDDVT
jgi:predicted PurR-regulated permease PerM